MTDTTPAVASEQSEVRRRGGFSSRNVFILAAIGSAVGLGNIWRFPYVAYDNGGGSFIIPYLVALLCAGIPFLFLDYVLGHRFRGSPPLAWARLGQRGGRGRTGVSRAVEGIGWWQVAICVVIAVYYAAIIGWAGFYAVQSVTKGWGESPGDYLTGSFLKAGDPGLSLTFEPNVLIPLTIVWVVILVVMALGVQRGVGATSVVFIPLLLVIFVVLVIQALLLPGAADGLNAFFTPNWSALLVPTVWVAAFGQIFFSLSVGFGIMITYASYLGRREDLTGSGLVVGFANSSFELLAGIGVFAALGFMAQASGQPIDEVVQSGLILAFVAFPVIINEAPAGNLLGVLFFVSLVLAGITSMISIVEVVISSIRDKFELQRRTAVLSVVLPMAVVSILLLGTNTALYALDVMDHFINSYGILVSAIVSMIVVIWLLRRMPFLRTHINGISSVKVGIWWTVLLGVVTPLVLSFSLGQALWVDITTPYEEYPGWLLGVLGWGVVIAAIVVGALATLVPWRDPDALHDPLLPEPTATDTK